MKGITLAALQATGLPLTITGPAIVPMGYKNKPGRPEEEFKAEVLAYAKDHGWKRAHFRPARTAQGWRTPVQADGKGFPDLVMVRERVVWIELKVGKNRLSKAQQQWQQALLKAGQEVYTWWPEDWSEIRRALSTTAFNPLAHNQSK